MKRFILPAIAALALACGASRAAVSNLNLNFSGSQGGAGGTGFDQAYNLDPASFSIGPGGLTITTVPGDIFGDYEHPVNSAKNVFYTDFAGTPADSTIVEAHVTVNNYQQNYQGGGIWMGTDENHYIRFGPIHNGSNINAEALRENMDLWPGLPGFPGPGGDINGQQTTLGPVPGPIDAWLRLIRQGDKAQAFVSTNGQLYTQVGGPGYTFDNIVTGPGQGVNGGTSIQGGFKVGVYAFGGGGNPATVTFHSFSARAVPNSAIPEPGSLALLFTGAPVLLAFRRRKHA